MFKDNRYIVILCVEGAIQKVEAFEEEADAMARLDELTDAEDADQIDDAVVWDLTSGESIYGWHQMDEGDDEDEEEDEKEEELEEAAEADEGFDN